jgi:hypothetical protein
MAIAHIHYNDCGLGIIEYYRKSDISMGVLTDMLMHCQHVRYMIVLACVITKDRNKRVKYNKKIFFFVAKWTWDGVAPREGKV